MSNVTSLTVHKNNLRQHHRSTVRSHLKQAVKDTPPEADGFILISWTKIDEDAELAFSTSMFKDNASSRLGLNDALRAQLNEMLERMREVAVRESHTSHEES